VKPLPEAQREVLDAVRPLEAVRVPLHEALGLVLAEPVTAPHDIPPFANSAMDGFAVRAEDAASVPVVLEVVEDVPAGHVAFGTVDPGTAIRIMTGAPMPGGADAVVKVEDTESDVGSVRILAAPGVGDHVRPAGGDVAAGAEVFAAGIRLTPPHLGVLATIGITRPTVRRRPRVAIVSTGDEVLPPETEELPPGRIRDANRPLLTALLAELGVEVVDLGIVPDDASLLRAALRHGAGTCDAVFTSGGVSMGDYDLVKQVLVELGDIDLWRVAMQPAKPFAFGSIDGTPLFGLPGNPVSVLVAFEQFARPALLTMMGSDRIFRPRVTGVLDEAVSTDPEKDVFLRVLATYDAGEWRVRSAGGQSSNVLSAAATADAFAVVPVGTSSMDPGETVSLEMLRWPERRTRQEVLGG
jgi:molybdopterin molybdotransferase